ncbi:hypothetical protein, partial [Nocardia africana]
MGEVLSLNPVVQLREIFESLPILVRRPIEMVVFGGDLPRADISGMRRLAAELRDRAAELSEHAGDSGNILTQHDSVGVFGGRLRATLRTYQDGADTLRHQAQALADHVQSVANDVEHTLCVMLAFGIELGWRIVRMLAAASAAGPTGELAAAAAVEETLAQGRAEVELMRTGLKEAYGRLALNTMAKLSALGPVRFAMTAGRAAVLPMAVDGGVQLLQVAAGNRNSSPIGHDRSNPTGIDLTSILVAGVSGAGGVVGGTLAARFAPAVIPRVATSRTLAGLVHGTAGAVAGLGTAAMITGWPQDFDHILSPMLNGAFAGTVHAQPGAHSRPGSGTEPAVDGSEQFTRPDLSAAGPPVKISAEARQAWETARTAWNAAPDNANPGGEATRSHTAGDHTPVGAGQSKPTSVPSEGTVLADPATTPPQGGGTAGHASAETPPLSAGAEKSTPHKTSVDTPGRQVPRGHEPSRSTAAGMPRVTAAPETAAPPKVSAPVDVREGGHTPAAAGPPHLGGEQASAAEGGRQGESRPAGEGEGSATDNRARRGPHPRGAGEGPAAEDGPTAGQQRAGADDDSAATAGQRSGSDEQGSATDPATRGAQNSGGEAERPAKDSAAGGQSRGEHERGSAAKDDEAAGHPPGEQERGSAGEDGPAVRQPGGGEDRGSAAEDGRPGAEVGQRGGDSGSEGSSDTVPVPASGDEAGTTAARDRAEEVLADFHARSGDHIPEALKLSNLPDEVLKAGLFHPDANESLIAGMEIIRRGTTGEAPGGMVLRQPQLEGGFEMARRPVQMLPGQGKTLMFMSYSLNQAVRHGSVLLVTTADGLAHREFTEYRKVLSRYGIDVLRADQETGFGPVTPGRPAIVVATGETVGHLCNAGHTPPRRAVLDEMDAIVDRGEKTFIRSEIAASAAPEATVREVFAAHDFLAEALAKGQLSHADFGLKQLTEEVDVQLPDGTFGVGTEYWYDDQAALTPAGRAKVEALPGGKRWLRQMGLSRLEMAASAEFTTRKNIHYVMDQGKIVIIDQGEHGLQRNPKTSSESRWSAEPGKASLAQAVEAKEIRAAESKGVSAEQHGIVVRADVDSAKSITAAEIYGTDRFFDHITGASGTLTDLGEVLKTVYGLDAPHAVDPFNRSRLVEGQPDVHENTRAKLNALAGYAHEMWGGGQGRFQEILCHRNDLVEKQVRALLRAGVPREAIEAVDADRIANWGADWETELQKVFDAAGEQGKILVINRQGQRGVDIAVSDAVLAKGGMHVWMTEVPEHAYIYDQAKNRTARNGKPGTAQALMSPQDALIRNAMHLRGVREAVIQYEQAVANHRTDPTPATHDKLVAAGDKLGSLVPGLQQRAHHHATADFILHYAPITDPSALIAALTPWHPRDLGGPEQLVDRSARLARLLGIPTSTATALATALDHNDVLDHDEALDQNDVLGQDDPSDRNNGPGRSEAHNAADHPRGLSDRANLPPSAVETLRQYLDASAPGKAVQYALFTDEQALTQLTPLRDRLAETIGWDPADIEGAQGLRNLGAAVTAAQLELARALGDDSAGALGVPVADVTTARARDVLGEAVTRQLLDGDTHPVAPDSESGAAVRPDTGSVAGDPMTDDAFAENIVAAASLYLATAALLDLVTEIHRRSPNSCVNNGVTAMRVLCPDNADHFTMPPGGVPLRGHNWDTVRASFRNGSPKASRSLDEAVESLKQRPGGVQVLTYKCKDTEAQGSDDADNLLVLLVNDSEPGDPPNLVVVDLAASRDGRTDDDFGAKDLADRRTLLNKAVEFGKWQREQQKFVDRLPEAERAFWTIDFGKNGDLVPNRAARAATYVPPELVQEINEPYVGNPNVIRQGKPLGVGSRPSGDGDDSLHGGPSLGNRLPDNSEPTPTLPASRSARRPLLRRRTLRLSVADVVLARDVLAGPMVWADEPMSGKSDPVRREIADPSGAGFSDADFVMTVRAALSDLPDPGIAEQLVMAHLVEGMPLADTASRLGLPPATATDVLAEAIARLRTALDPEAIASEQDTTTTVRDQPLSTPWNKSTTESDRPNASSSDAQASENRPKPGGFIGSRPTAEETPRTTPWSPVKDRDTSDRRPQSSGPTPWASSRSDTARSAPRPEDPAFTNTWGIPDAVYPPTSDLLHTRRPRMFQGPSDDSPQNAHEQTGNRRLEPGQRLRDDTLAAHDDSWDDETPLDPFLEASSDALPPTGDYTDPGGGGGGDGASPQFLAGDFDDDGPTKLDRDLAAHAMSRLPGGRGVHAPGRGEGALEQLVPLDYSEYLAGNIGEDALIEHARIQAVNNREWWRELTDDVLPDDLRGRVAFERGESPGGFGLTRLQRAVLRTHPDLLVQALGLPDDVCNHAALRTLMAYMRELRDKAATTGLSDEELEQWARNAGLIRSIRIDPGVFPHYLRDVDPRSGEVTFVFGDASTAIKRVYLVSEHHGRLSTANYREGWGLARRVYQEMQRMQSVADVVVVAWMRGVPGVGDIRTEAQRGPLLRRDVAAADAIYRVTRGHEPTFAAEGIDVAVGGGIDLVTFDNAADAASPLMEEEGLHTVFMVDPVEADLYDMSTHDDSVYVAFSSEFDNPDLPPEAQRLSAIDGIERFDLDQNPQHDALVRMIARIGLGHDISKYVPTPEERFAALQPDEENCLPTGNRTLLDLGADDVFRLADGEVDWQALEGSIRGRLVPVVTRAERSAGLGAVGRIIDDLHAGRVRDDRGEVIPDVVADSVTVVLDNGTTAHRVEMTKVSDEIIVFDPLVGGPLDIAHWKELQPYREIVKAWVIAHRIDEHGVLRPIDTNLHDRNTDYPEMPTHPIRGGPHTPEPSPRSEAERARPIDEPPSPLDYRWAWQWLKAYRRYTGLTQKEFGGNSGQRVISRAERGMDPKIESFRRICATNGIPEDMVRVAVQRFYAGQGLALFDPSGRWAPRPNDFHSASGWLKAYRHYLGRTQKEFGGNLSQPWMSEIEAGANPPVNLFREICAVNNIGDDVVRVAVDLFFDKEELPQLDTAGPLQPKKEIFRTINDWLKAYRRYLGRSQKEFSGKLGAGAISLIERGGRTPDVNSLREIFAVNGIPDDTARRAIIDLFEGKGLAWFDPTGERAPRPEDFRTINDWLKAYRHYLGRTQKEFAGRLAATTVTGLEAGATPDVNTLQEIFTANDIPDDTARAALDGLFGGKGLAWFDPAGERAPRPEDFGTINDWLKAYRHYLGRTQNEFSGNLENTSMRRIEAGEIPEVNSLREIFAVNSIPDDMARRAIIDLFEGKGLAWFDPTGERAPQPEDFRTINDWLKAYRHYLGRTQKEFAGRLAATTVTGLEAGATPDVNTLQEIFTANDIPDDAARAAIELSPDIKGLVRFDPTGERAPQPEDFRTLNDWLKAYRHYLGRTQKEFAGALRWTQVYEMEAGASPRVDSLREIFAANGIPDDTARAAIELLLGGKGLVWFDPTGERAPRPEDFRTINDWLKAYRNYLGRTSGEFSGALSRSALLHIEAGASPRVDSLREIFAANGIPDDTARAAIELL